MSKQKNSNTPISLKEKLKYFYSLQKYLPKLVEKDSIPEQSIEDTYVEPNLLLTSKKTHTKYPIKSSEIFANIRDQAPASRVLIEGDIGGGKSAFLQDFLYKWATHEITNGDDRFDLPFKIKLKTLLTREWKEDYEKADIRNNPLACLIDYSIRNYGIAVDNPDYVIELNEIRSALTNPTGERMLLALDGGNDIAHLISQDPMVKDIFAKIFGTKAIAAFPFTYILMTARANTLTAVTVNEFERIIENEGFNLNGAQVYVSKYFTHQTKVLVNAVTEFFSLAQINVNPKEDLIELLSTSTDPLKLEFARQLRKIDDQYPLGNNQLSIIDAITCYYTMSKNILDELLDHPNMQDFITNPMTMTMLCMLYSDPTTSASSAVGFSLSKLYEEFIIWLNKRHSGEAQELTRETVLNSPTLMVLRKIAYEGLNNNDLIGGNQLSNIAASHDLTIGSMYQTGLLKVAIYDQKQDLNNLIHHQHSFVRLSIQDYLAACLLKEHLMSKQTELYIDAAEAVAAHRNEEQYLMMLKFIAEMMTETNYRNPQPLVRFWEAVSCNINGVLELGAKKKVTLLMHLLSSAKLNGKIDLRIPNLDSMTNALIDPIVLENLLEWEDVIKASGYLSQPMLRNIWERLQGSLAESSNTLRQGDIEKPRILMNIIISIIDKLDQVRLLNVLENKLADPSGWKTKEVAIKLIAYLVKKQYSKFDAKAVDELINKIIPLITNAQLSDEVVDTLIILINLHHKDADQTRISWHLQKIIIFLVTNNINKDNVNKATLKLINIIMIHNLEYVVDSTINQLLAIIQDNVIKTSAQSEQAVLDLICQRLYLSNAIKILNEISKYELKTEVILQYFLAILDTSITQANEAFPIFNLHSINSAIKVILNIITQSDAHIIGPRLLKHTLDHLIILLKDDRTTGMAIEAIGDIAPALSIAPGLLQIAFDEINKYIEQERLAEQVSTTLSQLTINIFDQALISNFLHSLTPRLIASNLQARIIVAIPVSNLLAETEISFAMIHLIKDNLLPIIAHQELRISNIITEVLCKCAKQSIDTKILFSNALLEMLKTTPEENQDAICNIVDAIGKLNYANQDTLSALLSILGSTHNILTAKVIANLAISNPEIYTSALNNFLQIVSNSESIFLKNAIYALGIMIGKNEKQQDYSILHEYANSFITLLKNNDNKISFSILRILNKIINEIIIDPAQLQEIFAHLIEMLNTSGKHAIELLMLEKLMDAIPIKDAISLLQHRNGEIRQVAIKYLSLHINDDLPLEQILTNMLTILSHDCFDMELGAKQELHEMAKKNLLLQAHRFKDEDLAWVKNNFDNLMQIAKAPSKLLMEEAFHNALGDYIITKIESEFILRCINGLGFTITISSPQSNKDGEIEFTILFGNKIYRFLGSTNLKYLEAIVSAAIFYSHNRLSTQYSDYIPLLHNSGSGIRPAASDIAECNSLVDNKALLLLNWHISLLYASDSSYTQPRDGFMLVERRILGSYIVDKIIFREGKTQIEQYMYHPDDIFIFKARETLFTKMEYSGAAKSKYLGLVFDLPANIGEKMLTRIYNEDSLDIITSSAGFASIDEGDSPILRDSPKASDTTASFKIAKSPLKSSAKKIFSVFSLVNGGRSNQYAEVKENDPEISYQQIDNYQQLTNLFNHVLALNPNVTSKLSGDWSSDHQLMTIFTRKQLLQELSRTADSIIMDIEQGNEAIERLQQEVHEIKVALADLLANLKNIDLSILSSLIAKEELSLAAQNEIALIALDPRKNAFYKALIKQLNAVYLATSAISSQMVANDNKGTAGKIGGFLTALSAHTPLVGLGVYFVGEILNGVDQFQQDINVEHYSSLVPESESMRLLSEIIARSLAQVEITLTPRTDILEVAADAMNAVVSVSVSGVVAQACHGFKQIHDNTEGLNALESVDYAAKYLTGNQELEPSEQGESDAASVAKIIIANIFLGKYTNADSSVQDIAASILQDIRQAGIINAEEPDETQIKTTDTADITSDDHEVDEVTSRDCCCSQTICTIMLVHDIKFDDPNIIYLTDFLTHARPLLNKEQMRDLVTLTQDNVIFEHILESLEKNTIEEVLAILFPNNPKQSSNDPKLDSGPNSYNNINDYVEQIASVIGAQELASQGGLLKNYFSKASQMALKTIAHYAKELQELLNHEIIFKSYGLGIGSYVTAAWLMLEYAIADAAKTSILMPPPPYRLEDDLGGPGGGGGGGNGGIFYEYPFFSEDIAQAQPQSLYAPIINGSISEDHTSNQERDVQPILEIIDTINGWSLNINTTTAGQYNE